MVALAIAIEQARVSVARGAAPDALVKQLFIEALARLISEAMRAECGDPALQAMVLRHRAPRVREYASLAAHADRDRRLIRVAVDAIAHPAKQERSPPGLQRQALARLHASASSAAWSELADTARRLLLMTEVSGDPALEPRLRRLVDSPALGRLERLAALGSDDLVQRYQALWDRQGPRSGTPAATAQGVAARQRGAAVEALAAQALEALARRLNGTGPPAPYRVVTSMRVPSSLSDHAGRTNGAKGEWDAVLLRQADTTDATPAWDVCLLVEVKASVDAATTDFPRLQRGLRVLAQARNDRTYPFMTRQGIVLLRGASLGALTADREDPGHRVLYCCDAPAEASPRLLSAASRMQLLSTQASLAFASRLAENQPADPRDLESVWQQLLESPRWHAVLHQYVTLRHVRGLTVHIADLLAAIDGTAQGPRGPDGDMPEASLGQARASEGRCD
jgi:hypothetical protein